MKKTLALLTIMSAFASTSAFAEDVQFGGTVATSCTLAVSNGSLGQNGDATVLSSALGSAGSVTVTANAIFGVTISNPRWTSTPSGYSGTTTFVASGQIGSTSYAEGIAAPVVDGTVVGVNLTATKDGGVSFANGAYTALVTATCG